MRRCCVETCRSLPSHRVREDDVIHDSHGHEIRPSHGEANAAGLPCLSLLIRAVHGRSYTCTLVFPPLARRFRSNPPLPLPTISIKA